MKLLESGRGKGGGLKLNHSDMSIQRCICGKEYRQTSYHYPTGYCSATCKRQDKTHVLRCQWCGRGFVSKITQMRKVCSKRCASRTGAWGSRGAFEEAQRMAIECLTEKGMSRKATWTEMQTDTNALRKLVCYIWGPNAWDYFGEIRKRHNAAGFKGARTRPLNVSEQMAIRNSDARNQTATAIKEWRRTGNTERAGIAAGVQPRSGCGILRRSMRYNQLTQKRKSQSKWSARERMMNWKSASFKDESSFRDEVANRLRGGGYDVNTEHCVCIGSKQRVDIFATFMGSSYAIEAKHTGRSNRADMCLGQALRKGALLGARSVLVFPSDVMLTPEFFDGVMELKRQGVDVQICNEKDICEMLSG